MVYCGNVSYIKYWRSCEKNCYLFYPWWKKSVRDWPVAGPTCTYAPHAAVGILTTPSRCLIGSWSQVMNDFTLQRMWKQKISLHLFPSQPTFHHVYLPYYLSIQPKLHAQERQPLIASKNYETNSSYLQFWSWF